MKNKKEINAGIIIIGNEVLSGRTKDINTSTLSLWLNSLGVQVKEVRIIPDNEKDIIETINTFKNKFSYVFTTGGIGPTHDDITAESVSKAFNIEFGYRKEAFSILEKYVWGFFLPKPPKHFRRPPNKRPKIPKKTSQTTPHNFPKSSPKPEKSSFSGEL